MQIDKFIRTCSKSFASPVQKIILNKNNLEPYNLDPCH